MRRPPQSHALFRLKFRFQLVLLWLPIIVGLGLMSAGGYFLGVGLAPHFGIDPNVSISAQPRGGQYFWTLMTSMVLLFLVGAAATYLAIALALRIKLGDSKKVGDILKGHAYPDHWYA